MSLARREISIHFMWLDNTFQIHLFVVLIIILSPTRLLRKIRTTVHTVQYHIRLGNSGNLELCVQMQMRSPI